MYHKYHTEAIVLEGRESGEADKVFALYTRDFGLVYARATSVAGEEQSMYWFDSLSCARTSLADANTMNGTIELIAVARVLYALGYISTEALGTALFTHSAYVAETMIEAESIRDDLLLSINRALSEAHL